MLTQKKDNQQGMFNIKRFSKFLLIIVVILMIPLVAKQFSENVHWTPDDFKIASILLVSVAFIIEFVFMRIKNKSHRNILFIILLGLLLLIWIELSVGLLNASFKGY